MIPWVPPAVVGYSVPANPTLIDEQGRSFRWTTLSGTAFAVTFIYTRCPEPNECPAISLKFARIQRQLPANARLLEITIDPQHDTPAALRAYGRIFGEEPARWILASGGRNEILAFARRFGVNVSPGREPGTLEHGEAIAVFDRSERLTWLTAGNTWQPDEIVAALQSASGGRANPVSLARLWFENFGQTCGALLSGVNEQWRRPLAFAIVALTFAVSAALAVMMLRLRPGSDGHAPPVNRKDGSVHEAGTIR
jgi:cytochrome oxidase Cu insertion factor (SCO1/SenC/PrrC family)